MNFFRCLRVKPIEQIFQIPFVLAITQIHQQLQLLFKAIPQEPIVDPSYSVDINPNNPKRFHLLSVEARSHKVHTACIPFVLQPTFFKPYVASSVQLRHKSMNVLFRHLIDFLYH